MKPGIYPFTHEQYHADPCPQPSLSASMCTVLLDQSPAHAYAAHPRFGNIDNFQPSAVVDAGSLAHGLLFEGIDNMIEIDADDYRTKAAKEARDAARAEGKIPVLAKNVEKVMGMAEAGAKVWASNKDLAHYQPEHGIAEQSLVWTEQGPEGKTFWFRIKPDYFSHDRRVILDGKFTMTSVKPDAFARQIMRMDYHTRAAFYLRGVKKLFGINAKYAFLTIEQNPPHEGAVVEPDDGFLALGEERVEQAISIWMQCLTTGHWPGYGDRIHLVEPPLWAINDEVDFPEEEIKSDYEMGGQA